MVFLHVFCKKTLLKHQVENGIHDVLQGVFLKKQKVPNGRGGFLEPKDFQLGRDITIYSHTFHIVGCDVFTKVRLN